MFTRAKYPVNDVKIYLILFLQFRSHLTHKSLYSL